MSPWVCSLAPSALLDNVFKPSILIPCISICNNNNNKSRYTTATTIMMCLQATQGTMYSKHMCHDSMVQYKRSIIRIALFRCCESSGSRLSIFKTNV